jgi:hypothetical protein
MAPPKGPRPPARQPNNDPVPRAESLGGQAASAARAAAAFYRGWRSSKAVAPTPLDLERQRQAAKHAAALAQHRSALASFKRRMVGGTVGVVGGAAVTASTLGPPSGDAWLAVLGGSAVALGAWQAIKGNRGAKELREPVEPPQLPPAAPPLPAGSPGAEAAQRATGYRMHIMGLLPTVEQLHPEAADQIRRADAATAPGLNALVERIRSMQRISSDLPGSPAAASARLTNNALLVQLDEGAGAYQELLESVISLSSAPPLTGGPSTTLRPAIEDMHAYAEGLRRAAQAWL